MSVETAVCHLVRWRRNCLCRLSLESRRRNGSWKIALHERTSVCVKVLAQDRSLCLLWSKSASWVPANSTGGGVCCVDCRCRSRFPAMGPDRRKDYGQRFLSAYLNRPWEPDQGTALGLPIRPRRLLRKDLPGIPRDSWERRIWFI